VFRRLAKLCDAAGVPAVNPHGLRHAAVTLLQNADVHPRVVQQLAGHSSLELSDVYTGQLEEQMRAAVDTLDRRLAGEA
jgi:integrase